MAAHREGNSSGGSRVSRREERRALAPYPIGQETRLPIVMCLDCKLACVVELRIMSETKIEGRSFIKCPRNGISEVFL